MIGRFISHLQWWNWRENLGGGMQIYTSSIISKFTSIFKYAIGSCDYIVINYATTMQNKQFAKVVIYLTHLNSTDVSSSY
jgi:hypothetical protein